MSGRLFAAVLALGTAAAVFAQTRSYGLLGMDTYPIILTSRIESAADLWGTFGERLMDGLYPGAFYRPLLNLSFALDHALWGLRAAGYQLTSALVFGGCALALYVLLMARPAPRPPWVALAGVAVYVFHPLQFEVLPFPARRPELLCSLFMLLALAAETRPGSSFRVLGAGSTLLAAASKETAVILPALVFGQVLFHGSGLGLRQRWLAAGRRALISAAAVAAYLAARLAVLERIGGHRRVAPAEALREIPETLAALLRRSASPLTPESFAPLGVWLLVAGLLLLAVAARRFGPRPATGGGERQAFAADLLFAALWLGLLAGVYAFSGRLNAWYFSMAILGFSFAFAGICEGLWLVIRRGAFAARALATAGLASMALVALHSQLQWSPLVRSYGLWERSTDRDALVLQRLAETIDRSPPGSIARLEIPPGGIGREGAESMFRGVVHLAHYSLHAWSELAFPHREVRVLKNRRALETSPLKPQEVVVILHRGPRKPTQEQRRERRGNRPPGPDQPPT